MVFALAVIEGKQMAQDKASKDNENHRRKAGVGRGGGGVSRVGEGREGEWKRSQSRTRPRILIDDFMTLFTQVMMSRAS